jgi:hypothetical protein
MRVNLLLKDHKGRQCLTLSQNWFNRGKQSEKQIFKKRRRESNKLKSKVIWMNTQKLRQMSQLNRMKKASKYYHTTT